jgi:uncharacterized protein
MKIVFDREKRRATLDRRGLDMARSEEIFDGLHLTFEDDRRDDGEVRYVTIGYLGDRMVFVVWTMRDDLRRIISPRKANGRETKRYGLRPGERT